MVNFRHLLSHILTKKAFKKVVAYSLLIFVFYIVRDFIGLFLLTFIFSYLFLTLGEFLKLKFDVFIDQLSIAKKKKNIFKKGFGLNSIIIVIYVLFVAMIIFTVSDLLPKIIAELSELTKTMPFIADQVNLVTSQLQEIKNFNSELGGTINQVVTQKDYEVLFGILNKVKTASLIFLQVFLALILSFVFIIDRHNLQKYLAGIKTSNFSFLYKEYKIIFDKIVKSFGLIFKAQSMIAGVNAVLTILGLLAIGFVHLGEAFPYILTLGLMVFIAGFIPVLGMFLSGIPIVIIAFTTIGGYQVVFEIFLLIAIIHMIEAYYLNPKIVSSFLELPVSLTFLILIVSEHLFGIAGLLIGVSMFYFITGLFRDFDHGITKTKRKNIKNEVIVRK